MPSYNKVILVGNLGSDPEYSTLSTGTGVAKVSLATTERYKDKQTGELKESTQWHRLVFWDRLAETANQYLKKGSQIFVEGRIKYGQYTGNDGVTRYTTDISVTELVMLGHRNAPSEGQSFSQDQYPPPNPVPDSIPKNSTVADLLAKNLTPDVEDDDIPF